MAQAIAQPISKQRQHAGIRLVVVAWLVAAVFYFLQYSLRSAPSVMMPQLSEGFGLTAMGVASLAGVFYYGYSTFSLVAGPAIDRFGTKTLLPIGAATVGLGALLFATGNQEAATVGRFMQGIGGAFAAVGAPPGPIRFASSPTFSSAASDCAMCARAITCDRSITVTTGWPVGGVSPA